MAWRTWLTPEQTRQLKSRYPGSLDEIAIRAMENPAYAGEFARLTVRVETDEECHAPLRRHCLTEVSDIHNPPERFPRLYVARDSEQEFAMLVVAALHEFIAGPEAEPGSRLPKRDPLPATLVEKVLRLRCDDGKSWAAIEEELKSVLSRRKIDYVRVALKHDDLAWDRSGIGLGPGTVNTEAGIVLPHR